VPAGSPAGPRRAPQHRVVRVRSVDGHRFVAATAAAAWSFPPPPPPAGEDLPPPDPDDPADAHRFDEPQASFTGPGRAGPGHCHPAAWYGSKTFTYMAESHPDRNMLMLSRAQLLAVSPSLPSCIGRPCAQLLAVGQHAHAVTLLVTLSRR
jgi:hypothetical protein